MKTIIKLLACVAVITCVTKSIADDAVAQQRKTELNTALQALQEPQQPNSHIEHPGWAKSEVRDQLRSIAAKYPNTEEALTADLWRATAELEVGQTVIDPAKRREGLAVVASTYSRVIKAAPASWQAKAARIGGTGALLGAQRWDEARAQSMEILANIASYTQESNTGYVDFLAAHRTGAKDVEPETRLMLLVATTSAGKTTEAIALAEETQTKFPEWSKKNIPGVVDLLRSGKNPIGGS